MSYIEQYVDFLENRLDSDEEQKFAENFALDSEFREEFKKFLILTKALKNSSVYFTPSEESKNAVFSALGFTSGITAIPVPEAKPIPKPKSFFKGRFFTGMMASIVTFILTLLLLKPWGLETGSNQVLVNNSGNKNQVPVQANVNSLQVEPNQKISSNQIRKKIPQLITSINEKESPKNDLVSASDELKNVLLSTSNFQIEDLSSSLLKHSSNNNNSELNPSFDKRYDTIYFVRSYDSKFRFEFKNSPSWFTSYPRVQPYQMNIFNNLSVSIYYPLYKTLLIGAEYRQETFYVIYDGKDNKGKNMTYYQQPNLSTFGVSLRYSPFDLGKNFKPFGQVFLGGNIVGFVSREMLGVEYYPYENVYFLLGGELNQFFFRHGSTWFNANKLSLNYGIGMKF
jgi:hypothetical protein